VQKNLKQFDSRHADAADILGVLPVRYSEMNQRGGVT
jgi:hypothetical protein